MFLRYFNVSIFSLLFHTLQVQNDNWNWNNSWCYELACINLQMWFCFSCTFFAWFPHESVPYLMLYQLSIVYLFSLSTYQTKYVITFLFRQLMTSKTLRFIFDHPLKQGPTVKKKKKKKTKMQKLNISRMKSFIVS